MDGNSLSRCLHCGGEGKLKTFTDIVAGHIEDKYAVSCTVCGCGTPKCPNAGEAIAKWESVYIPGTGK